MKRMRTAPTNRRSCASQTKTRSMIPHAKSRQGLPRQLVPLHLRRGAVSSGARTQPVLALIWTHVTFNEAVGALPVCRVNDPRYP
jgi:hypothetical protein